MLASDGSVWSWGSNEDGQLGIGTRDSDVHDAPVQVSLPADVTPASVAAGMDHSLLLEDDGTVLGWGWNTDGQVGDGTHGTDRLGPVAVTGLTAVQAIAAGAYHSLALRSDGTVWAWGSSSLGQLGDGGTDDSFTPVQVSGLTGVTMIAAGSVHSIALKSDGTVWTWGDNVHGQIGNGDSGLSPVDSSDKIVTTPFQVPGLTGVVAVSAGTRYNLALKADGTVWAWGGNDDDLFTAITDASVQPSPVQVPGLSHVTMIASGSWHALVCLDDGTVWGWGSDYYGQLGDDLPGGSGPNSATPVAAAGLADVADLRGGENHSMALESDGTVLTWGSDESGQLGLGGTSARTPTAVGVF